MKILACFRFIVALFGMGKRVSFDMAQLGNKTSEIPQTISRSLPSVRMTSAPNDSRREIGRPAGIISVEIIALAAQFLSILPSGPCH
jgi:hypothetical protein